MEIKINKEIKEYTETMFSAYRCGSSFLPCLLVAQRSVSTSDAVPFWERKRFHGFAWWEPRLLRLSALSDTTE